MYLIVMVVYLCLYQSTRIDLLTCAILLTLIIIGYQSDLTISVILYELVIQDVVVIVFFGAWLSIVMVGHI